MPDLEIRALTLRRARDVAALLMWVATMRKTPSLTRYRRILFREQFCPFFMALLHSPLQMAHPQCVLGVSAARAVYSALLAGVITTTVPVAAQVESFDPVVVRTFEPVEVTAVADEEEPFLPMPPETYPLDEASWKAIKEAAATREDAPEPDQVLEVEPPQEAVAGASFPGLGFGGLYPPDTTLGKSANRLIQAVNSSISLYTNQGAVLQTKSLASFFGATLTQFVPFDPRVVYDRLGPNQRFFVVASQYQGSPTQRSRLYLAVSRNPDPPNLDPANWCIYHLSSESDYDHSQKTFADYPMVGVGVDTLLISDNRRFILGAGFTYAIVQAFQKPGLTNNATSCSTAIANVYRGSQTSGDQLNAFTLQPAIHYTAPASFPGTTNPVYLVSTRPTGGSSTYRIWRVRNTLSGASPSNLQVVTVTGPEYGVAPDAPQPGLDPDDESLDSGDPRIRQAAGVGDALWVAHAVLCNTGGGPNESCVRVLRFTVSQDGLGNPVATLTQQVTLGAGTNVFAFMPGIAVNQSERAVVPFLFGSSAAYLSFAWAAKNLSASTYGSPATISGGTCARRLEQTTTALRTGDYVAAQTDPSLTTFWIGGEHNRVVPPSGGLCTWGTEVSEVQ